MRLKSLRKKEEPLPNETSQQDKVEKKEVIEVMVVLSTLTEKNGRTRLESTFGVIPTP